MEENWSETNRDLILQRIKLRKEKKYDEADVVKNELLSKGIEIRHDGVSTYSLWGPIGSYSQECTWD